MSAKEEHFVLFKKLFLPLRFQTKDSSCLVPRPHYSARPKRFGSRGPIETVSRPFASDTSPK